MRPVEKSEIVSLEEYEHQRPIRRPAILAAKDVRRVAVGPDMDVLFENRDTVWYQVQEMLRIENMYRADDIAHELATYNELVPAANELSATLMIEYSNPDLRAARLAALQGLEHKCLQLFVGSFPPVPALFDQRQMSNGKVSAVHFVKWKLPVELREAFRSEGLAGNVKLVCDHQAYKAQAVLRPETIEALWRDLTRDE